MKPCASVMSVLLMLGGCAAVGEVPQPTLLPPAQWSHATQAASAEKPDLSDWWSQWKDPVLDELVHTTLTRNRTLSIAVARLREARALTDGVDAVRRPMLDLNAQAVRRRDALQADRLGHPAATTTLFQAGLDASWELDLFGGLGAELAAARADTLAAGYALADVQVSLVAEVVNQYTLLRGLQQRLDIARRGVAARGDALEVALARERAGLASTLEPAQSRSDLHEAMSQLPVLEQGIEAARLRLATLSAQPSSALDTVLLPPEQWPAAPDLRASGWPSELLERRADLRQAQSRVLADHARLAARKADLFPRFYISAALAHGQENGATVTIGPGSLFSFGPVITLPVFDAGRIRSRIAAQDARLAQSMAGYEQLLLQALEEVETALSAHRQEGTRIASLEQAFEAAIDAEKMADARYLRGLDDYLPVLDARRSRYRIEDALAAARTHQAQYLVGLYKALGGGWHPAPLAGASATENQPASVPAVRGSSASIGSFSTSQ